MAVREKVDFGPQKELGFPIREKLLFEEEAEETEEQSVEEQKKYYVLMDWYKRRFTNVKGWICRIYY